jgi:hypothetical protein
MDCTAWPIEHAPGAENSRRCRWEFLVKLMELVPSYDPQVSLLCLSASGASSSCGGFCPVTFDAPRLIDWQN